MVRKEKKLKTNSDTHKWIATDPEGRHLSDMAHAF